jgi:hypothetical protein
MSEADPATAELAGAEEGVCRAGLAPFHAANGQRLARPRRRSGQRGGDHGVRNRLVLGLSLGLPGAASDDQVQGAVEVPRPLGAPEVEFLPARG